MSTATSTGGTKAVVFIRPFCKNATAKKTKSGLCKDEQRPGTGLLVAGFPTYTPDTYLETYLKRLLAGVNQSVFARS
jgi:hypothetical protein